MTNFLTEQIIDRAHLLLRSGDVVAFPTETVYGLGANAYHQPAVEKIFLIKGRPSNNPLIAHVSSLQALELVTTPDFYRSIGPVLNQLAPFIPGPLSIVIPKNEEICAAVSAGLSTVAVRIPNHPIAQALLARCSFPIAAPSANPSNYISPTSAAHVVAQLGDKVSLVLDGGPCSVGIESTILDLTQETPRILRQGIITAEMLALALNVPIHTLLKTDEVHMQTVSAPGMLKEHYAPNTPLKVVSPTEITSFPPQCGLITLHELSPLLALPGPIHKQSLSKTGEMDDICRNLFKTLREFDSLALKTIYIESCERTGIGRAIMDRIDRASAKWAAK